MLPAPSRLTRREEFADVTRRGRRAGRRLLVVHAMAYGAGLPRAGFVVSKAVGGAVVRHGVARRLRHLLGPRLTACPAGTALVVRALPAAATARSAELAADLDRALGQLALLDRTTG